MSGVQFGRALVAVLLLLASSPAAFAVTINDLIGVWEAKLRFGPDARGTLVVERGGEGWIVSIAGYRATVAVGDKIAFELPEGEARFRGWYDAKTNTLGGHWLQGRTQFNGLAFATPVRFKATGAKRWEGEVAPIDDAMTMFLKIEPGEKGAVTAYIRNPERNVGKFVQIARLTMDGNVVHVFGKTDDGEREVITGRYDEENQILSLPIPDLGGTYDFNRSGALSQFYPRGAKPGQYVYRQPLQRDDGWRVGSLEEAGFSRSAIEGFVQKKIVDAPMESVGTLQVHSFLMARHGKLVVEEYFHGFNADQLHDTRSASKSMGATLLGAAMETGLKIAPTTPVYSTMGVAASDPRKAALNVENLITMSSGLDCDDNSDTSVGNENKMQNQRKQPDWYAYTLALDAVADPGTKTAYCSASPNLAGGVLARATGKGLDELFETLVARPLGIKRYALSLMPTRDVYMGGGWQFTARDFIKFGQLMLDKGVWNGKRALGADYVARASSPLKSIAGIGYGYLWWVNELPYKGGKVRASYAGGNGGQAVMVVPELDLVVSFMGGSYGDRVSLTTQRVYVPEDILPAIVK